MSQELKPLARGDTLIVEFTLDAPWTPEHFTGGIFFTVRGSLPPSTVLDDDDVLGQCSTLGDDPGIEFTGQDGVATIDADVTRFWPSRPLYWEFRGVVAETGFVARLKWGMLPIESALTRSPVHINARHLD